MGQIGQIMNLTVLPFGNAKETQSSNGSWVFSCQHGADECTANLIETCAIAMYTNQNEWFPFFTCMEGSDDPTTAGPSCASQASLDWSKINGCVTSSVGNQVEHSVALATKALKIQYTPWTVVNGKHLPDEISDQLLQYVCDAYTGTKPAPCSSSPVNNNNNAAKREPVCRAD